MTTSKPIKIAGMGKYLPRQILSSEIENRYGIPLGWSEKYSGVATRHHVTTESIAFMGARAAEQALANAGMKLSDMDMLISAGGTYDFPLPNQASVTKNEMEGGNDHHCPAIDIDSTCLSFVTALDMASRMMDGKSMKNVLIVSSEVSSNGLDPKNWETQTLFGDAAAAAVVTYDESSDSRYIKGMQRTYSEGVFHTVIEAGGNAKTPKDYPYDADNSALYCFKMKGKILLRLAKNTIPGFMDEFFGDLPVKLEDLDAVVPHQASRMGIHIFNSLYSFKEGTVKESLSRYGNCIAASIPITLADSIASGDIKRGDTCFLSGTSAGFSIGGVLIKY